MVQPLTHSDVLTPTQLRELNKQIIKAGDDVIDSTDFIREQLISDKVRHELGRLHIERNKYQRGEFKPRGTLTAKQVYYHKCLTVAPLCKEHYDVIFDKVVTTDINIDVIYEILTVLKMVEIGQVNKLEGDVLVGQIMQRACIDNKLKNAKKINPSLRPKNTTVELDEESTNKSAAEEPEPVKGTRKQAKDMNYEQFKRRYFS